MELIHEIVLVISFSPLLYHSRVELCREETFVTNSHMKCVYCLCALCVLLQRLSDCYE